MKILIVDELENFINEMVLSGAYNSASEVVNHGLRLLKEQEQMKKIRLEELRGEILKGYEQSQRGESKPLDIEAIKAEGERRLAQKRNGK